MAIRYLLLASCYLLNAIFFLLVATSYLIHATSWYIADIKFVWWGLVGGCWWWYKVIFMSNTYWVRLWFISGFTIADSVYIYSSQTIFFHLRWSQNSKMLCQCIGCASKLTTQYYGIFISDQNFMVIFATLLHTLV